MIVRYFVWRWRGSGWKLDGWPPDDPTGYRTEVEAQARLSELLAAFRQRQRQQQPKEMYPPPIITTGAVPRLLPKPKERRHRYTAAELNGEAAQTVAMPAGSPRP
jgi:hypothetical protein